MTLVHCQSQVDSWYQVDCQSQVDSWSQVNCWSQKMINLKLIVTLQIVQEKSTPCLLISLLNWQTLSTLFWDNLYLKLIDMMIITDLLMFLGFADRQIDWLTDGQLKSKKRPARDNKKYVEVGDWIYGEYEFNFGVIVLLSILLL